MSYQLKRGEPLAKNLRQICRRQIEAAAAAAHGECDESTPVHATRKHLKGARGALRLLRPALTADCYTQLNCILRDAGRLVSDLRDAEVRLQTVRQLERAVRSRKSDSGRIESLLSCEVESLWPHLPADRAKPYRCWRMHSAASTSCNQATWTTGA